MRSTTGTILLATLFTLLFSAGCDRDSTDIQQSTNVPTATLVQSSGCRHVVNDREARYTTTPDCVILTYDRHKILRLRHTNAVMNCCISGHTVSALVSDGLIRVVEQERYDGTQPCRCLCLYDLEYEVRPIEPGIYRIVIDEPNLAPGEAILEGIVDLSAPTIDTVCVEHTAYRSLANTGFARRVPVPVE